MTDFAYTAVNTVSLAAGDTITVAGSCTVRIVVGTQIHTDSVLNGSARYGPFGSAAILTIQGTGSYQYDRSGDIVPSGPILLTAADIASPTAEMLADTTATYVSSGGARYTSNGTNLVGLSANWFTPIVDITRNSANDATDTSFITMATFVIPPNVVRIGSIIDISASTEYTNSANVKNIFRVLVNGTILLGPVTASTTQTFGHFQRLHIHDANTVLCQTGGGNSTSVGSLNALNATKTIAGVVAAGLTIVLDSAWATQPILGEFIRLKFGKIVITP